MQHIASKDGTNIAYKKFGSGPALIIIGGSLAEHIFYEPLAQELATDYTVYIYDRRGRGESGDAQPYTVNREVEDVLALIAHAGSQVYAYGHSAGSALALRVASGAGDAIKKLVLADPPFTPHGANDAGARADFAQQAATVQAFHDTGDYKGAARFFLSGFGLPADMIEGMLASPAGKGMIDCARALPYDYAQLGDGLVPTDLARDVTVPTLVLTAEATPEAARELTQSLPNGQLKTMPASAHELDAAVIAQAITPFLK